MKDILEWMESGKSTSTDEDYDHPIDNSWIVSYTSMNQDDSNDILHQVSCLSDYAKWVPKRFHRSMLQWNHVIDAASKDKSLKIREFQTSTLGVISAAWYVLFEAYRSWGAEYAAKKGKAFTSELAKEISMLSDAWMKVKAGKPV